MTKTEEDLKAATENTAESREQQVLLFSKSRAQAKQKYDEQGARMAADFETARAVKDRRDSDRQILQNEAMEDIRLEQLKLGNAVYKSKAEEICSHLTDEVNSLRTLALEEVRRQFSSAEDQELNDVDFDADTDDRAAEVATRLKENLNEQQAVELELCRDRFQRMSTTFSQHWKPRGSRTRK